MAKLSKSQLLRKSVSMIHSISCRKVRRTSSGLAAVALVSNVVLDEGNCRKRKCVSVQTKQVNNVQGSPRSLGQQQSCRRSKPAANNQSESILGCFRSWVVQNNPGLKAEAISSEKEKSQHLSAFRSWVSLHDPGSKTTQDRKLPRSTHKSFQVFSNPRRALVIRMLVVHACPIAVYPNDVKNG